MPATETIHIPAREGRGAGMRAGDRVRVIDPEGGQVADVFAFCTDDPSEYHSAEHTRVYVNRLFPMVDEQFVTNRRRPILTLEADDSPGVHDMLCAACDPTRYHGLGVEGWHASCQENLLGVMTLTSEVDYIERDAFVVCVAKDHPDADVYELRDGKIVRALFGLAGRDQALKAVGLAE